MDSISYAKTSLYDRFGWPTEGNGDLTQLSLLTDTLTNWGGGLSVTKHANGRDWWVIVKKHYKNKFYKFLLTPLGIQSMGYQLIGLDDQARLLDTYSFSPNGEILAGVVQPHEIALFNFDRCTGLLSNHQIISNPNNPNYGCENLDFRLIPDFFILQNE